MISLFVFIFILGLLIIVHEFGHFIMAKKTGVRVEQFSLGFGPQLFKKKKNNTEYSIAAVPLGGFVKLAGDNLEEFTGKPDEYFSKSPGARFKIIFFGPFLNYILGFVFFWVIFFVGYPTLTSKVGGFVEGLAAKGSGLEVGDKITSIDGQKVEYWEDMQRLIQLKTGQDKVGLVVIRGNKELPINVALTKKEISDMLGQKRTVGLLGITPFDEIVKVRHGFLKSFILGGQKTWELTTLTLKGLWMMITGKLSVRESVTGPLGIFIITSKAAKMGLVAVMHLIAVLSISLAIFNLLPLPILDGGHILFLGLEKIRGKAISLKAERVISQIGVTLIITLALFVTYNDIVRFFGDRIAKFFKL